MKTNHHLEEESNMNGKIAIVWFDILIGNREKKEDNLKNKFVYKINERIWKFRYVNISNPISSMSPIWKSIN